MAEAEKRAFCADVKNGIDITDKIPPPNESLCWRCMRSYGTPKWACSWHRSLSLPKGCKYVTKTAFKNNTANNNVYVVVDCPLFIKENEELKRLMRKTHVKAVKL